MLNISLAAERIGSLWGFPITNSFLATWIVMAALIVFAFLSTRKLTLIPSTIQLFAESVVGGLYDFFAAIAGKHVKQFFPIVASLFVFILLSNWIGLLPGVGTVGFRHAESESEAEAVRKEPAAVEEASPEAAKPNTEHKTIEPTVAVEEHAGASAQEKTVPSEEPKEEFVPLLRAATADLNMTLALAIVSVIAMQYFGFANLGHHYLSRFISFKDPINFSVGILELVSDLSKIISFAFRLFGNIFAGEVLLAVIAFLMPFIVPLPFLLMEIFVGLIQALVFSMLSTAFFSVAVSHGEGEH